MVQLKFNKIKNTVYGIRHNIMYTNYINKKYNNHIITDVNNILHGYRGTYTYGLSCYNKSLLKTGRPNKFVTDAERKHAKNEQNKGYYHREKEQYNKDINKDYVSDKQKNKIDKIFIIPKHLSDESKKLLYIQGAKIIQSKKFKQDIKSHLDSRVFNYSLTLTIPTSWHLDKYDSDIYNANNELKEGGYVIQQDKYTPSKNFINEMVNKLHKGVNNYLKVIGDSVKDYAYTIEGLDVDRPHIHLEINYKNDAIRDTVKHLKSLWSHGHADVKVITTNRINDYILKEINYNNYQDRLYL